MTPKEKAEELIDRFLHKSVVIDDDIQYYHPKPYSLAKQCALIAVDEIIKVSAPYIDKHEPYYQELDDNQTQVYWQEVKQEIENL